MKTAKMKNRKKGFTMVEITVAFLLASILFTSVMSVLAPVYRIYSRTRSRADALLVAGNVVDAIRTTAVSASYLTADAGAVHVGRRITYTVSGGYLMYQTDDNPARPVFDEKYYNGKTISLTGMNTAANVVELTVTVHSENAEDASVTAVISPLRRILGDVTTP